MKLKLNYWIAVEDIINCLIFSVSWFVIIGASFSDSFNGTSQLGGTSIFLSLVAAFGAILHIIQFQQCKRWGNSLVGSILGIIGNVIFFLAPLFALPAIILLIIGIVFEFINKVTTETDKPLSKIWYKQWWVDVAIAVIFIAFIVSANNGNDSPNKSTSPKTSTSSSNTNDKSNNKSSKDLISFDKNIIKTPKGSIEILKEATGKTTDGKDGVILMYKITNNSDEALTPKQILKGNQISVYETNSKSEKPAEQFFGADNFQDLNDESDSSNAIYDAINKDDDNWDKTKIEPHQSITMSDGKLWKVENKDNTQVKVTDSINNIDGNVINKNKDTYKISDPVEKIDITKWNG